MGNTDQQNNVPEMLSSLQVSDYVKSGWVCILNLVHSVFVFRQRWITDCKQTSQFVRANTAKPFEMHALLVYYYIIMPCLADGNTCQNAEEGMYQVSYIDYSWFILKNWYVVLLVDTIMC